MVSSPLGKVKRVFQTVTKFDVFKDAEAFSPLQIENYTCKYHACSVLKIVLIFVKMLFVTSYSAW